LDRQQEGFDMHRREKGMSGMALSGVLDETFPLTALNAPIQRMTDYELMSAQPHFQSTCEGEHGKVG
jgi:hypothetical protein